MIIKPADPSVKVRDPKNPARHVPAEGMRVRDGDSYWLRRIKAGEVVEVVPPPAAPAPAPVPEEG